MRSYYCIPVSNSGHLYHIFDKRLDLVSVSVQMTVWTEFLLIYKHIKPKSMSDALALQLVIQHKNPITITL